MGQKITELNWNTAFYYSDNLMAFISMGASLDFEGKDPIIQYLVNLTTKDYEDIYQSSHLSLEEAVATLNIKYEDWELKNLAAPDTSENGCSTCSAH